MTECITPPGPDDLALVTYNEGDGDQATIEHLQHCSHCRARAEALAQTEKRLSTLLYRINCLSIDELQDYYFGFLPASQNAIFTAHIQTCPHCMRELAMTKRFVVDDAYEQSEIEITQETTTASSPGILERIETVIARWLQGGANALSPALAGLRGADTGQVLYSAGEMQIGIDIQPDRQQPNRREIVGAVMGAELLDVPSAPWAAHLWQESELVAVAALDELGSFSFANLVPTDYELIITGPGIAIDVASLPVR